MDTKLAAELYLSGMSTMEVAKKMGVAQSNARLAIIKHGVPMRSVSEGLRLAFKREEVEPSPGLIELVDGLLLSDASIIDGIYGARLQLTQSADHRGWIEQVRGQLVQYGVVCSYTKPKLASLAIIKGRLYTRQETCGVRTISYDFFKKQRVRWYPAGVKIVPHDVTLTPLSLSHWYAGDGSVGGKGYHARFCTDSFAHGEVEFLISKLHDKFGWSPLHDSRNRILLDKFADRISLVSMLNGLLPTCFSYKLNLRTQYMNQVVIGDVEARLRQLFEAGTSYGKMSKELGMSKSGVHSACMRLGLFRQEREGPSGCRTGS